MLCISFLAQLSALNTNKNELAIFHTNEEQNYIIRMILFLRLTDRFQLR